MQPPGCPVTSIQHSEPGVANERPERTATHLNDAAAQEGLLKKLRTAALQSDVDAMKERRASGRPFRRPIALKN